MPLPIVFALFSMVTLGSADFLDKKAQERGISLETYLMAEPITYMACSFLTGYFLSEFTLNRPAFLYGILSGVFAFLAYMCFVTSLKEGQVGVNTLIVRLNFVPVAILAIYWLGEEWSLTLIAGLILAALAIMSVTVLGQAKAKEALRSPRTLALTFLAMIFFAFVNLIFKIGVREGGNFAFLFISGATYCALSFSLACFRGRLLFPPGNWIFAPITGTLKTLAFISIVFAFRIGGAASVVVPIGQLSFLTTFILAAIFLRERIEYTQWLGIALATAAIFMLSR